jgi:hypothetical protein
MRVPIRLTFRTVAIRKSNRLVPVQHARDTTGEDHEDTMTTEHVDLKEFAARLAHALAAGNADTKEGLLKALHQDVCAKLGQPSDPRYNNGQLHVTPNPRDDRFNDSEIRRSTGCDGLPQYGSGPADDRVRKANEDVIQAHADLVAATEGVTAEKAYALACERHPQRVAKMAGVPTEAPEPGDPHWQPSSDVITRIGPPRTVAKSSAAMASSEQAWQQIEAEAQRAIQKSARALTYEQAIDRVLKSRPDLCRAFYGIEGDPAARR